MADDNKGIVMGTAGLNPASLFAATREVFKASGAPPSRNQNTGVACPECEVNGITENPVISTGQGLQCNMGHKFVDTEALLRRPHHTVPVTQHKAVQENYVTVSFQIPGHVMQELQAKYPDRDRLNATLASLARHMLEPNTLVVGSADLKRISDAAGIPIRTPAELFGVVSQKQQEINDLKEAATQTPQQASAGGTALRRGELILWFDPPTTGSITEKAAAAGVRLEDFLEKFINEANANAWF